MDLTAIATITFTLATLVGITGAALIDAKVTAHGAASVTMKDRGARLLMRACPAALAAAALITFGAWLANL